MCLISGRPLVCVENADFAYSCGDNERNVIKSSVSYEAVDLEATEEAQVKSTELRGGTVSLRTKPLVNVSLSISRGELVAVVGSVGSGKTSLLLALMKQMERSGGQHLLQAKVAYVSQEHWIQNKSLRENVLFYSPFNEERYISAIDASQLSNDLLMLPSADLTVIGERGINLSGGQKARVNLARSFYARDDVDLFVLDDPLAAVDAHVGKAIFEEGIMRLLEDKARIVVFSSNYHLLPQFDKIVLVAQGQMSSESCDVHTKGSSDSDESSIQVFHSYQDFVSSFPQFACDSYLKNINCKEEGDNGLNECSLSRVSDNDLRIVKNIDVSISQIIDNESTAEYTTTESSIHQEMLINGGKAISRASSYRDVEKRLRKKQENLDCADLMEHEDREYGSVSIRTIAKYYAAAIKGKNGMITLCCVLALFSLAQACRVMGDLWIGIWAKYEQRHESGGETFSHLVVFTMLLVSVVLFTGCRTYYFLYACIGASANLHYDMLESVIAGSVNKFFDVTPIGRILNRFTKDLDAIDSLLPDFLLQSLQSGFHVLSILILCLASSPFFFVAFVPIILFFYLLQKHFRMTSRELKRLDGVSRSPIYNHLAETLNGISTVRAFRMQDTFLKIHHELSNDNKRCFYAFNICNRWLSLRLDVLCSGVVLLVSLIAVIMVNFGIPVADHVLGLAIVYSIQLLDTLQWTARVIIETENNLTSVERLLALNDIEKESSQVDVILPSSWPSQGALKICNLNLRYREGLPLVLKNVTVSIPGGSKLGVCGRTGSGKRQVYGIHHTWRH